MLGQIIVFVFVGVCGALAVQLPPEIPICHRSDPNFSDCVGRSMEKALTIFKNGNKEFGFPPLEPFEIEKLEIGAAPGNSVNLNQKYENLKFHGMIDSDVKSFSLKDDNGKCVWEINVFNPGSRMEADYSLSGQVLLFPINGKGKCNVTLTNITNKHRADCERYTKKGKTHLRLKNYKMDMSTESCHFDFPDLLPGNEQISREIQKTVDENSQDIFKEVKVGFEEILAQLHMNGANSVFSKIPEEELFPK